jgi:uncharacterized protein (TIGR03437 family)
VTISVPETLTGASASLEVESNGLKTAPISVGVGASAFYLFTRDGIGRGPAAAINQDRSINSPEHPAPVGSIVSVFGTGAGVKAPVQVLANNQPAIIEYAGPAPGLVPGVTQVNFRVPATRGGTAAVSVGPSAAFPWPCSHHRGRELAPSILSAVRL